MPTPPGFTLSPRGKTKLEEYLSEEPSEAAAWILLEEEQFGLSLGERAPGEVGCGSCTGSELTLRGGVERRLRAAFPEVQPVLLVSSAPTG